MRRYFYQTIVSLTAVAALWSLMGPSLRVQAFNPQPDPPAFGLIGVDPYSTVRLNAVCPDTPLPGGVSPGPCLVTLAFRDANGTVLSRAVKTLDAGQGAWIDWNGAQNVRGRTEIQPSVPAISAGFALITVEVFDNMTGRTLATMAPAEPKSLSFVGR
jgi:hypothetical protein